MQNAFDLHDNCQVLNALDSATLGATTNGEIIDTQAFHGLEFILSSGTITTGDFTVTLEDGEAANLSDAAAVAADDVLGSITFAVTDDDTPKRMGYLGKKRYVRMVIAGANTPVGVFDGVAVLYGPLHAPVANQ